MTSRDQLGLEVTHLVFGWESFTPFRGAQFLSAKPANQFRVDEAMLGEIHIHPWASTPICESPRGLFFFSDVVFYIVSLGH